MLDTQNLWQSITRRWGTDTHYWYPLKVGKQPADVLAFDAQEFHDTVPLAALRKAIGTRHGSRLWEIDEGRSITVIDLDDFEPVYFGSEAYWTSGDLDWIVYASHEESVTIGGAWLLQVLEAVWPECLQHLWGGG